MPEYKDEIKKLVSLQDVDSRIYEITTEKDTLPAKIKQIKNELESKKQSLNAAEDKYKKVQVAKNEAENSLSSAETKIKKHEGELALIKTNKEYTAMIEQIAGLKADVSKIEEKILTLFDDIESALKQVNVEKALFQNEQKSSDQVISEITAREKELDKQLSALTAERDQLKAGIDRQFLARYEQILKSRGKCALSRIKEDMCSECNLQLRPQLINEVKLKLRVVTCDNCSRMLYEE
jgi:predicted  nucleic acid-binding Zn-ribbon protein